MAEKVEDLNLPIASVSKIVKEVIPDFVNIGKDARTALARAAAVFVMYVSSHASQEAQRANRKTMIGQDVLDALANLEFDDFLDPLNEHLKSYKDTQKQKKDDKQKAKQSSDGGAGDEENVDDDVEEKSA